MKTREAEVVRIEETDDRIVLEEDRERTVYIHLPYSTFILTSDLQAGNMPVPIGQSNGGVRVIDKARTSLLLRQTL